MNLEPEFTQVPSVCLGRKIGGVMSKKYLIDRLREPSTWRGLIIIAGLAGYTTTPDQVDAIMSVVAGLVALVDVFTDEKRGNK